MVKNWQLIGGPWLQGAPSHGITGAMDNPALRLHHFEANLFDKWCTKFHQNRPSFVEDITKRFGFFLCGHRVYLVLLMNRRRERDRSD